MRWRFESPCSKVMEIPSCPGPGYPCRVYSGLPSTFVIWISFFLFPLWHSWSGIGSRSSLQTSLEKVKGVMHSSLGSWTPDFNIRTRFSLSLSLFFFFNWRKIALQCCVGFCRTTSQISRYYTHLPSFSSLPPFPPNPSGSSQSQAGLPVLHSSVSPATYLHMVVYICRCYFLCSSHSFLPSLHPQAHSLFMKALDYRNTVGGCWLKDRFPQGGAHMILLV